MIITYKFRAYPTPAQASICNSTLETCRRLYNNLLAERIQNHLGYYEQQHEISVVRKDNKYLQAVQIHVLQDVAHRLDKAFQSYFTGLSCRPKFRKYGRYNSFTFDYTGFKVGANSIRLSFIGDVRVRFHRQIEGIIKRVQVIRDIDQWFMALSVEEEPVTEKAKEGQVGVDLGVTNVVTLSDGMIVENPRFFKASIERVISLQRSLSRKRKGSHNREKARMLLAKAHRRIKRQREDFAHKLSDRLTKNSRLIVFEDLKVGNMVRNHSLAQAIMDSAWSQTHRFTAYKAERRGGRVVLVNPRGSSQKCSGCGMMVPKDLNVRVHNCPDCGLVLDRDINAARNILALGLEQAHAEVEPLLVQHRRISKFVQ